jgi:hypothetical protein
MNYTLLEPTTHRLDCYSILPVPTSTWRQAALGGSRRTRQYLTSLIRQLLLTWPIYSESYEYSPFFYHLLHFHTKAFENEIRILWPN